MTKQQAIDWMKRLYFGRKELSDEDLFTDWVVVNWAYKKGDQP